MTEFPPPCTCSPIDEFGGPLRHEIGCPQSRQPGFSPLRDGAGFLSSVSPLMDQVNVSAADEPDGSQPGIPGRCNANAKQAQRPCRKPAGWGTDHVGEGRCRIHGGNTPSGRKNGKKLQAATAARTLGLPVEIDPAEALLQEVWRSQGHVVWYGEVIAQLRKGDLGWGTTKVKTGGDDHGTTQEARENIYLKLYNEERKHLARVSAEAIKAGVEQKRLDLETHRAQLVVAMLGSIFDDLDLSPEQASKLDELVPKALIAIAGTEATK